MSGRTVEQKKLDRLVCLAQEMDSALTREKARVEHLQVEVNKLTSENERLWQTIVVLDTMIEPPGVLPTHTQDIDKLEKAIEEWV